MEKLKGWWQRMQLRIDDHIRGRVYRRLWEDVSAQRRQEAEMWSKEAEEKDALIYSLKQERDEAIERVVSRWVGEYLRDEGYWRRLFERVLSQPTGRRLWVEALYKQLDKLSDEERLELFYGYLESRGGKLRIEFPPGDAAA